jgi:hypothetical protein
MREEKRDDGTARVELGAGGADEGRGKILRAARPGVAAAEDHVEPDARAVLRSHRTSS